MKQDFRLAWRFFRKRPGFAVLAVAPLAVGIGLSTGIFSIANALLLRPLPFPHGERLMALASTHDSDMVKGQEFQVAAADLDVWKREARSFESLGGSMPSAFNLAGTGAPQRVVSARATASLFATLGVHPILGRVFSEVEERQDAAVAVISREFWSRETARDPRALGRTLRLDGRPFTVIGVLPRAFRFGPEADVWIPYRPTVLELGRNAKGILVVGRLRPGTTRSAAANEMKGIAASIARQFPDSEAGWGVSVRPLRDVLVESVRSAVWILFGAAGLLLLIACANVSNLLLARAVERRGEAAVRAALGAGRWLLLRSCLAESALLAGAGGILGVLLAKACLGPLLAVCPVELSTVGPVGIDLRVLEFTLLVSAACAVLSGAAAGLEAWRANLAVRLNDSGRSTSLGRGGRRFQGALVAAEVGIVFLLVTGSAVAFLAFSRLSRVEPGFRPAGALRMKFAVTEQRYPELSQRTALLRRMVADFTTIPGVSLVAATHKLPLDENSSATAFLVEGGDVPPPGDEFLAQFRRVTPGYLRTMGTRLAEGREFEDTDDDSHPPVAVVSRELARRYWHGASPVGKRLHRMAGSRPWLTVVGVADDVRDLSLAKDPPATLYIPYYQGKAALPDVELVMRTVLPPSAIAAPLRDRLASIDRDLPLGAIEPLESLVSGSLKRQRFQMLLMGLLSASATLLAAVGLFGLISYSVSQQTRELSIRMALGATAGRVVVFVLRRGVTLASAGLIGGGLAVAACSRLLAGALPGTPRPGPSLLAGVAAALGGLCMASSWFAARRAARIPPSFAIAKAGTR